MGGLGVVKMSTQEKATKTAVLPITAPGTMKAVEQLTDMSTEEIKGIYTALSVIDPRLKALNDAVKAGKDTEKALETFRKDITAQRAAAPMFEAFIKSHPEYITDEEKKIADSSRSVVTQEIETLNVQIQAIQTHLVNVRSKFGKAPVVSTPVKPSKKGSHANKVTDDNKASIEAMLKERGYIPVFVPVGDGTYRVNDTAGTGKTGLYASQLRDDWYPL